MTPRKPKAPPPREQPAVVEPPAGGPVDRQYEVLGEFAVLGRQPGDTFTAALDTQQEARMLARGSLRATNPDAKPDTPPDAQ